jgi:L-fuconolactonase
MQVRVSPPTRRQFLAQAAAAAIVAGSPALAADGQPIIDAHLHIWDRTVLNLPWLKNANATIGRDFSAKDYAAAIQGLGIERAVYVEVGADPSQRGIEAGLVQRLCAQDKTIKAAIVSASPGQAGFANFVRPLAKDPAIKGIRESYRKGSDRDQAFLKDLGLLAEVGWRYEFLLGGSSLEEAARIAAACPRTAFVLDHCANPSPECFGKEDSPARKEWREGIARLGEKENVVCKISGLPECSGKKDPRPEELAGVLDHCLDRFGSERVMFGSNWPVCLNNATVAQWLATLKAATAGRGEAYQRKLLHDNAARFYAIKA